MTAGERKDALNAAGFAVTEVVGYDNPVGITWHYYPEEAVASPEAQALIATFEG